jgi:sugar lactone lactonase YvrE
VSEKSLAFRYIVAISIFTMLRVAPSAAAQKVFTVAGGYVGDGKPATSAGLASPAFAAFDPQGNMLISDARYCRVRKVDKKGIISTIAGTGICGFSGDGGPATKAKLSGPLGIVADSRGNIFFTDYEAQRVRKIDSKGIISTLAGNGKATYCGDGKQSTKSCLNYPSQLALGKGPKGEILYVADTFNQRIRQVVLSTGIISTVAGTGQAGYSGDGFPATQAELNYPAGVAFDGNTHSLWISDTSNSAIRQVDLKTGIISTFFGPGTCVTPLELCSPQGLTTDTVGNLHVADSTAEQVFRISVPGKSISVDAGVNAQPGFNGDKIPANTALLGFPFDVIVTSAGDVLTLDNDNQRIRKGSGSQKITTIAGGYIGDGKPATSATMNSPTDLAFDQLGNLYIADTGNSRIRKVSPSGTISTLAGNGRNGYSGDGGPATKATLHRPWGVAADPDGNVFIADYSNSAIRKVDTTGIISTFASIAGPFFMTTDPAGNLYVADGCVIQKFVPDGTSSVVAGMQNQCGFNSDGIPATQALLDNPIGVALDSKGNLYIGDTLNHRVRMVDTSGIIHTVAGNGTCGFSGDGGPGTNAMLCFPRGVGLDANRNLYIADFGNLRVRVVDGAGIIKTLAGTGKPFYNGNGLPALKTNIYPNSVAVSPSGTVHIVDLSNNLVRKVR